MRLRARIAAVALLLAAPTARAAGPRVVILDDGVRVNRDLGRPLERSPWPAGPVDVFAMRGETVGLQVVVEATGAPVKDVRVLVEPLVTEAGARLDVDVERFVERFVVVRRASGNERGGASLAFTRKARPGPAVLGAIADPLVPASLEEARAAPGERAAVWIDLTVPAGAAPGLYSGALLVRDASGELATRRLELRVLDATMPWAAAPAFVFYAEDELRRRMGSGDAEWQLRALLHAHHLGAIRSLDVRDAAVLRTEGRFVSGTEYTAARGYRGPGEGVGEGVVAFGSYGTLGEPSVAARDVLERLARAVLGDAPPGAGSPSHPFVYAIDERCESDWPARWVQLLDASPPLAGVRVGATCGDDPARQAATLVMQTPESLDPARARAAVSERGAWVWAYNGRRPFGGPPTLDTPATDLRANAWIMMRYDVPRWFYWEATFWFDDNRGGRGGERGFDPFVEAETFHNADGDYSMGDGILVYPGRQREAGMVDYGVSQVFPSVRLKNLRRGVEDGGYVALARGVNPEGANAVVRRMVPHALARATDRPSWPQRARPWLEARRELAEVVAQTGRPGATLATVDEVSEGCSIATNGRGGAGRSGAGPWYALFLIGAVGRQLRARTRAGRHGDESTT